MENKYYLLLTRFTSLEIKKEDVEDYLNECDSFNTKPTSMDFLSNYLGNSNSFDSFCEKVEDTDIEDDTQFYKLIKEIREND
jgi:hypothetical protein